MVVIDPGGPAPDEDIVAAARAERERRAKAPPASKSITNKNLVKSQESKPAAKESAKAAAKPGKPATEPAAAPHAGTDEAYWRGRSRELRELWKEAADQIADLERDADGLRRRFYAESDPYVRDTRVKPDWDRVLDRIREMQAEAERRRQELRDHLEEGRRAGALPGWLREGIELEPPAPPDKQEAGAHQAVEPPVYTEPPLEPPQRPQDAAR